MAPRRTLLCWLFQLLHVGCHVTLCAPQQQYALATDWGERYVAEHDLPAYNMYNAAIRAAREASPDEAIELYRETLALKPDIPEALINLSNLLAQRGDIAGARGALQAAVPAADHKSLVATALSNLGHLEQKVSGKDLIATARAESYYRRALEADPTFVDALFNLGTLLDGLGRFVESVGVYTQVLELCPAHSTALLNLANANFHRGDWAGAVAVQRRLTVADGMPFSARRMGLINMGQVYRSAGEHAAALRTFEVVMEMGDGGDAVAIASALQARRSLCSWANLSVLEDELLAATRAELEHLRSRSPGTLRPPSLSWGGDDATKVAFGLSVQPYDALLMAHVSLALQAEIASAHARPFESAGLVKQGQCGADRAADRVTGLRVAYLSFDFREHPMGFLTAALVTGHALAGRVNASAVSYGEDDGSALRQRIKAGVEVFLDVFGRSDVEAAAAMADMRPHILVDLMAHTRGTRAALAASRPGPLLINYLGYPSTVGGRYCDAAIVDRVAVPPEAVEGFTERLVFLPHSYQANDFSLQVPVCSARPAYSTGAAGPVLHPTSVGSDRARSCLGSARAALLGGSPDDGGALLCNFNNIDKMEPVSFGAWMHILAMHPAARLVMLDQADKSGQSESSLRCEAASHGVHPSRLVWAPRVPKAQHLARLTGCDVVLDNFVYGAHTTASDALWAAVPLVSLRGIGGGGDIYGRMQSRVGASLLHTAHGHGFLATHTVKEFTAAASSLASSEAVRLGLRRRLGSSGLGSPLFDSLGQVREMEAAYAALWEVHTVAACSGKPARLGHHVVVGNVAGNLSREAAAIETLRGTLESSGDALAVSDRVLAAFPENADAWHLRGLALHRAGSLGEARRHIRIALGLLPNKGAAPFFWGNLAQVELAAARPAHGTHALAAAVALAPWDAQLVAQLQALLLAQLAPRDAVLVFSAAHGRWRGAWRGGAGARAASEGAVAAAVATGGAAAVDWLTEALWLDPTNHAARLKLGAALEAVGRPGDAMRTFLPAVRAQHAARFAPVGSHFQGRRVAIYCEEYGQTWWPNWGPRSVGSGLGGSEEAVVFLSREVAALGWAVEVYGVPPKEDQGLDAFGVRWLPTEAYDTACPPEVFIAWR